MVVKFKATKPSLKTPDQNRLVSALENLTFTSTSSFLCWKALQEKHLPRSQMIFHLSSLPSFPAALLPALLDSHSFSKLSPSVRNSSNFMGRGGLFEGRSSASPDLQRPGETVWLN